MPSSEEAYTKHDALNPQSAGSFSGAHGGVWEGR